MYRKIKIKLIVLVTLLSSGMFSLSQNQSDIGISVTTSQLNRLILEYRIPIAEKWKLNIGASYGANGNPFYTSGEIVDASDSTVTQRYYNFSSKQGNLRIGASRQLKNSMFSVGADLLFGYRNEEKRYTNKTTYLTEDGWKDPTYLNIPADPFNDPTASRVTNHYFVGGLQIGAQMNIPIGERFLVNCSVSGIGAVLTRVAETQKIDPYNEFPTGNVTYFDFESVLSVGLKYKFGAGKSVE